MSRSISLSTYKKYCMCNCTLYNSNFLYVSVSLPKSIQFELFGEMELVIQSKKKNLTSVAQPSVVSDLQPFSHVGCKRKLLMTDDLEDSAHGTPICTNQVRRSSRSTRYMGFKQKIISDAK